MFLKSCQQDNKQNEGIKTDFFYRKHFLNRPTDRASVRPSDRLCLNRLRWRQTVGRSLHTTEATKRRLQEKKEKNILS